MAADPQGAFDRQSVPRNITKEINIRRNPHKLNLAPLPVRAGLAEVKYARDEVMA